jgi:hypothetical protein
MQVSHHRLSMPHTLQQVAPEAQLELTNKAEAAQELQAQELQELIQLAAMAATEYSLEEHHTAQAAVVAAALLTETQCFQLGVENRQVPVNLVQVTAPAIVSVQDQVKPIEVEAVAAEDRPVKQQKDQHCLQLTTILHQPGLLVQHLAVQQAVAEL